MPIEWINVSIIALVLLVAILGYQMGAGKVVNTCMTGMFGYIAFVVMAIMFGGLIRKIPFVEDNIVKVTDFFAQNWGAFWGQIYIGVFLFHIAFFVALQIVRILVVRSLTKKDNSDIVVIRVGSRLVGAAVFVVFFVGLVLVFFATMHYYQNTKFYSDIISGISGTWLEKLYSHNPIVL